MVYATFGFFIVAKNILCHITREHFSKAEQNTEHEIYSIHEQSVLNVFIREGNKVIHQMRQSTSSINGSER